MNRILSASQIRAWDAYTIAHEPIASIDLMERASQAFVEKFVGLYPLLVGKILIVCGLGNNGGDGLAVARLLQAKGHEVEIWVIRYGGQESADFQTNYQRCSSNPIEITNLAQICALPTSPTVIIDALFGSGLNKPLVGLAGKIVEWLNAQPIPVVAIDIASGLSADSPTFGQNVVRPTHTISFQIPKLAFFLPQNADFVGNFHIVPIGLHETYSNQVETTYHFLTADLVGKFLKKRPKFGHKGTFGHALIIGGSYGKMGAVVLATEACLRSGAGLATAYIPQIGYHILQTAVPEAMALTDKGEHFITQLPDCKMFNAIGIGVGLDKKVATQKMLLDLFIKQKQPLTLDADALNIMSENKFLLELLPAHSILTPHPKEFERLTRPTQDHFERLDILRNFAQVYGVYVILKGAYSALATPTGEVFFNTTGNAGMATGGSGDVLTGIITGFLAQGYTPFEASALGIYVHGLAGDIFVEDNAPETLLARDLVANIGKALMRLSSEKF
jgi:NAD(P)H-hydrate epimerase